jgi:hypothetical protein
MSHRSLIVLPDDTAKPILDAVGGAQKSLRVKDVRCSPIPP